MPKKPVTCAFCLAPADGSQYIIVAENGNAICELCIGVCAVTLEAVRSDLPPLQETIQ